MDEATNENCPFQEGDRVNHPILGSGTVSGTSEVLALPDPRQTSPEWRVPVRWDDDSLAIASAVSTALTLVLSPELKLHHSLRQHWKGLFEAWRSARRNVEAYAATLWLRSDPLEWRALCLEEDRAFRSMQAFLDQELAEKRQSGE
ncbi:hypothetical protein IBL26_23450 [Roseomonas aerophila]|uniref:Uncharacterized protein n=1 Tax=Teichococcus aerophilus TaxID=1224513 RepID=A0ABR7RU08_9PROT|nr:hypothetical protein [Pseudoroseomonas aerophila]MBC9209813.1 hypothetical protein [Pseudoroseomonas aerophila]